MTIVLIILGSLAGLVFLYFIIKVLTKPKIKTFQTPKIKKAEKQAQQVQAEVKSVQGLSFEEKFIVPEEPVKLDYKDSLKNLPKDFPLAKKRTPKKKSLAEQINELSPELKALILDRGLARKDIDINSKKD